MPPRGPTKPLAPNNPRVHQTRDDSATSTTVYNAFGDTDTVIDATNVWNTATYDQAGRQLSATHAGTGGAATPLMTTFSYDKRGLRTSTVTPEGVQTAVGWDAAGRMSAVTVGTGAAAATTSLFYDPAGNNTRVRNGRGYDTVLDYQSWNLLEARIEPETSSGQPAVDRTWGYRYDPAGLVVSQTQPGSVALNRTFDEAGRTLTETGVGATGSRTFAYDTEGRINSISHPATAVSVTYDDRGLPTTVTGGAGTATFDWDARGQLVTRTDSTGTAVYTYDDAARLLTETDPLTGGQIEYGYDNAGRRVYQANYDSTLAPWPDTPTRWTGHDTYGRVEWDVFVPDSNGNPETYARSYGFDGDNNLHTLNVWGTSNPADTGFQWFNYDTLGQLAEAWTSGTPTYYTYDKAGNRTSAGGVSYTYDPQNRLTSGGGATNTWSDRGTLDAVTTTSGTTTSTFDVFNQNLTNGTVTLTYDGLGRIATRNSTAFTYTGLTLDPTTDGTWTFNHRPDGTVVSLEQNGGINPRWAVLDARNNLVALRDPNTGHVDNTTDYTPYGEPRATTGTLTPTIGYQSDYTDPTTNEVWMGARHYQPTTANFTSRDTHNGRLEQPVSLNRYTYAHNNPLTNWDPNGHAPTPNVKDPWQKYWQDVNANLTEYRVSEFLNGVSHGKSLGLSDSEISFWIGIHFSTVVEPNSERIIAQASANWLLANPSVEWGGTPRPATDMKECLRSLACKGTYLDDYLSDHRSSPHIPLGTQGKCGPKQHEGPWYNTGCKTNSPAEFGGTDPKILGQYSDVIKFWAAYYGVSEVLIATIMAHEGGNYLGSGPLGISRRNITLVAEIALAHRGGSVGVGQMKVGTARMAIDSDWFLNSDIVSMSDLDIGNPLVLDNTFSIRMIAANAARIRREFPGIPDGAVFVMWAMSGAAAISYRDSGYNIDQMKNYGWNGGVSLFEIRRDYYLPSALRKARLGGF